MRSRWLYDQSYTPDFQSIDRAVFDLWNVPVAVALAALRIWGHKSEAFQAVAHLYLGALIASWCFTRYPNLMFYVGTLTGVEAIRTGYDRTGTVSVVLIGAGVVILLVTTVWRLRRKSDTPRLKPGACS